MATAAFQSASVWEHLNPARIAAISATLAIHILAFGLLMMPVALSERIVPETTATEVVFIEPDKPKPTPLLPVPPNPPAPVTATPIRPAITPQPVKTDSLDAPTADEPLADAVYVPADVPMPDAGIADSGGEVDASTRAQYPIDYPPLALRGGITGTVIVLASYDATGRVTATRIHQGSRDKSLDRAALAGVRKWKINPRRVQGQAVGGEALVEVRFSL